MVLVSLESLQRIASEHSFAYFTIAREFVELMGNGFTYSRTVKQDNVNEIDSTKGLERR